MTGSVGVCTDELRKQLDWFPGPRAVPSLDADGGPGPLPTGRPVKIHGTASPRTGLHPLGRAEVATFARLRAAAALALGLAACAAPDAQRAGTSPEDARPNVLFIAVDDLNDWVGYLGGHEGVRTPNLDRLADRGVAFTHAYAPGVSCTPSRQAVLTGLSPSATGIYENANIHWRGLPWLADVVTLPQHFRQHGYHVAGGGKIFHALSWIDHSYGRSLNDPASWDAYFPSIDKPMPDAVWPEGARRDANGAWVWTPLAGADTPARPPYFFDWGPLDVPDSAMADHQVVDWAIRQLEHAHDRPFFLAVGLFLPHIPWFVPREYFEMHPLEDVALPDVPADDLDDLPPLGRRMGSGRRAWHRWMVDTGHWRGAVQAYLASTSFTDAQIGRLLDALAASRHATNTIVVLWSDHGFHLGEKETWEKFTLWEESLRVPFIVVAPGVTPAGQRSAQPVNLLDIYPTLAELAGLPVPAGLDGHSLVPVLRTPAADLGRPAVSTMAPDEHAARSRRWRYIRHADGSEELYDHNADPGEHRNLAGDAHYRAAMDSLAQWLPATSRPDVRDTR